ncbi:hypothetical protein FGO68_gene6608 [Halteria grandinella]|uniref:Uncharacterized protein n=1 Tax=Halteria grandinella TaxID=5974 RepID=A0A8J8P494_HALGN|nr:hypothetical protein FGO68_gene6608 [Halteria grandinella]
MRTNSRLSMMMVWDGKQSTDCKIIPFSRTTLKTKTSSRPSSILPSSRTICRFALLMRKCMRGTLSQSIDAPSRRILLQGTKRKTFQE